MSSRTGNPTEAPASSALASPEAGSNGSTARRPYRKPELRQLGSVRDLTFGSPVLGVQDGMGGRQERGRM